MQRASIRGTAVQLAIPAWDLRHTPFHFTWSFDWRNPRVRRVLLLMLPVTRFLARDRLWLDQGDPAVLPAGIIPGLHDDVVTALHSDCRYAMGTW